MFRDAVDCFGNNHRLFTDLFRPTKKRNRGTQHGGSSTGEANFSGTNDAGSTLDFNRDFDFGNRWGFELRYTYRSENKKPNRFYPSHHFGVVGGYRYQRYRWVNDDSFLRISNQGPFFGGLYRF
jgi:hypothetical protein